MSFAKEIKKEILEQEFNLEQAKTFISGIITSSGQRDGSKYVLKFNKHDISEIVRDLINQMNISHKTSSENRNWIIFENFSLNSEIKMPGIYFAGVFLGGGSISDSESTSYHLEIQFYSHQAAKKVQMFLNKYSFDFSLIQRRANHVLYLKKAEQISDFLKAIQAFKSLIKFEDIRINRDFKNQLNRYSNLDVYNQNKLAKASTRFMQKYNFIKKHGMIWKFRDVEIKFFDIKSANPYSSLEELTKIYKEKTNITKTRAGLSHYLIKLRKIYNENKT